MDEPQVIQYGVERAHYATILFFLLAYSHGVSAILRGVGKSVVPMVVMLVCWCLVRVTLLTMLNMLFHNILFVYLIYPFTCLYQVLYFSYIIEKLIGKNNKKTILVLASRMVSFVYYYF